MMPGPSSLLSDKASSYVSSKARARMNLMVGTTLHTYYCKLLAWAYKVCQQHLCSYQWVVLPSLSDTRSVHTYLSAKHSSRRHMQLLPLLKSVKHRQSAKPACNPRSHRSQPSSSNPSSPARPAPLSREREGSKTTDAHFNSGTTSRTSAD